jgi:hypothetical protein
LLVPQVWWEVEEVEEEVEMWGVLQLGYLLDAWCLKHVALNQMLVWMVSV